MSIHPPPDRALSGRVRIGTGEGRAIIVEVLGWTIALIPEDAHGIAAQLTFAADLIDARTAVATAAPQPIPKVGGSTDGKARTKRGRKAAEA